MQTDSVKSCNELLRFAQQRWPTSRNFCARGAPILQFFRASWAQNLRDPDAGRLFDSYLNAMLTQSTLSEIMQFCSARWLSARNFCARGVPAFRNFLQMFRPIFAQILRDFDAGLARYLIRECKPIR